MSRNRSNAGYIGAGKASSNKGALTSEYLYHKALSPVAAAAEEETTYDLDGTNIISLKPVFHFDAGKINGEDASGNPSDGGSITTSWKTLKGLDSAHDYAVQSEGTAQPTWYASGKNGKPYVYFDALSILRHNIPALCHVGPWTVVEVIESDTGSWTPFNLWDSGVSKGSNYATVGYGLLSKRASGLNDFAFMYPAGPTAGGAFVNTQAHTWNNSSHGTITALDSTRMLMVDNESKTSGLKFYVDGDVLQGAAVSPAIRTVSLIGHSCPAINSPGAGGFGSSYSYAIPVGKVYERFLFRGPDSTASNALSTADKNAIIAYVQAKYDLSGFTNF